MDVPTILEPRRGLETHLRKVWEELFDFSEFIYNNSEKLHFSLRNIFKHISIGDPTDAFQDPRYKKYFKEAFDPDNPCLPCLRYIDIEEDEFGNIEWRAPVCPEALLWLSFIVYTVALTRIDGLYLSPLIVKKKDGKRYFYLKWTAVLYGENISSELYEVFKLSPDGERKDKTPRKWRIDRKTFSLGYIPVSLPSEVAPHIKTSEDLIRFLEKFNPELLRKAHIFRESVYLLKLRWKEIRILERLFPIVRKKSQKLPYYKWLDEEPFESLAMKIISLRRLIGLDNKGEWFEFWEVFC